MRTTSVQRATRPSFITHHWLKSIVVPCRMARSIVATLLLLFFMSPQSTTAQDTPPVASAEWERQKLLAWEQVRVEFPQYMASNQALRETMVWINEYDAYAKANDPKMWADPWKPLHFARHHNNPAYTVPARQPSQQPAQPATPAQQVVTPPQADNPGEAKPIPSKPSVSPTSELVLWAIVNVAVAGLVAFLLYKLIHPRGQTAAAGAMGRRWMAWVVFLVTATTLPSFFGKQDVNSFVRWLFPVVVFGVIAFLIGWAIGLFKYRQKDGQAVSPPDGAVLEQDEDNPPPRSLDFTASTKVESRLEMLKELFDKNLISKDDYDAKRMEILAQI